MRKAKIFLMRFQELEILYSNNYTVNNHIFIYKHIWTRKRAEKKEGRGEKKKKRGKEKEKEKENPYMQLHNM